ncbi:hypothetical protein Ndes2526B_g04474 [Nannochloris sp. 'desiccata']
MSAPAVRPVGAKLWYKKMRAAIFFGVLLCIQGVALGRKFSGNVTRSSNSTREAASKQYVGLKYGRYCGPGNFQKKYNPINRMDRCCRTHDYCTNGNCSSHPNQCGCDDAFWSCTAAVARWCGLGWGKMCRYARQAVFYAAAATACSC